MNFAGGGGGLLSVLSGLFILAITGCCYALFWALVLVCLIIRQSYRGIRWLYRRHKYGREMHAPCDVPKLPQPYISPVEYRKDNHS